MEKVIVSGGSGLVGSALCKKLRQSGYSVAILTTSKAKASKETDHFYWNPETKEIDRLVFNDASYIIHLAGANIGEQPWTIKRRKQ